HGGGQHTSEILFRADAGSVARRRCGQSSPIIVSPGRQAEGSQSRPFSIQIVPASTMRYHAYLQWVRMASRNFSRTAVLSNLGHSETIHGSPRKRWRVGEDLSAFIQRTSKVGTGLYCSSLNCTSSSAQ